MRMTRTVDINSLLDQSGLKPSKARVQILGICMTSHTPVDVNFVAEKMGNNAHLATVYRTLEKFVGSGILERIDFQEGKFRYEYIHSHHHHAVCSGCGKVEDVHDSHSEVKAIEDRVHKESGFTVTKHALELFGICNKCQKKGPHV